MARYHLTFGVQYLREPHPLGASSNPNGWIEVHAPDELAARKQVVELIGDKWSMLYSEEEFTSDEYAFEEMRTIDYFPDGCSGVIRGGRFHPQ